MVSYLAAQARPAQKQARLLEQREELQRELTESLLGNWLTATDPHAAQQRGQQLLRALQAQAGRHGELLERLLPQRDTLRQLYQQQQHAAPAPTATPAPFGLDIDLFGAPETPAPGEPPRHPLPRGYSRIGSTICAACRTAVGCWSCSASKSRTWNCWLMR